jgi:deoxyhypusine synthase
LRNRNFWHKIGRRKKIDSKLKERTNVKKKDYLNKQLKHIDIKSFDATPIIDQFKQMAFQAKNIGTAAEIYNKMLKETECTVILCLAGSLFSAGLKQTVFDLVQHNMVDVIVSTGAIMVDQDFFEALGFRHYQGTHLINDEELRKHSIDRIYDTYIDEDDLRVCDMTIKEIADHMEPGSYSSRQFLYTLGEYLQKSNVGRDSVVWACYEKSVPIFIPALSDSSAGFGLVLHQYEQEKDKHVAIDSVKDFLELTRIKIASKETGLFMVGGGVPKNFAQDTPVAAEILGEEVAMHKYAIQITVADERDGGLSGSTLKEAHSWGKVQEGNEKMVFCEATVALPLIASHAFHSGAWKGRREKKYNQFLEGS